MYNQPLTKKQNILYEELTSYTTSSSNNYDSNGCIFARQCSVNAQSSNCGCCPLPNGQPRVKSCSSNSACECLLMTINGKGLCADTSIQCNRLVLCSSDNNTCLAPNTICVNNTQCNGSVCYPIEMASTLQCPPVNSTASITSTGHRPHQLQRGPHRQHRLQRGPHRRHRPRRPHRQQPQREPHRQHRLQRGPHRRH
ncbi:unnamed protein product [Rotaria socialis]|uniref:Uncharacterized protein n=1 Tax=Rotaria socialis TaxID=392032 RepID=A0A817PD00_9BILA|nr:unnamed protein product [Rotaria socialis]